MKLAAIKTTPVLAQLSAAFVANGKITGKALPLALAHWALETGWGAKCYCYNLGNAKATDRWCRGGGGWTYYECDEIVDGKKIVYGPAEVAAENPGCRFRAFATLAEGVADYVDMMRADFPSSFAAMQTGNAAIYAHTLKLEHYYTASEVSYTHGLVGVLAMVQRQLSPAPVAPPIDLQPLRDGQPGDTPGMKVARALRAFSGVSLVSPGGLAKLTALAAVDNPSTSAEAYARETTNCATTMRWLLALVRCPSKWVTQPDIPSVSMGWDLLAAQEMGALIPLRDDLYPTGGKGQPDAWRRCQIGWGLHYGVPGSNDDHVEWCLSNPDPVTGVAQHGGGGREHNAITIESGDIRTSMGRPLLHVIDIDRMGIPTLPHVTPAETSPDATDAPPAHLEASASAPAVKGYAPLALALWAALVAAGSILWSHCAPFGH